MLTRPALAPIFFEPGNINPESLPLNDVERLSASAYTSNFWGSVFDETHVPLKKISFGSYGQIFLHPDHPDQIIKRISPNLEAIVDLPNPFQMMKRDAALARFYESHQMGPKLLAFGMTYAGPILIKERVHGHTLQELVLKMQLNQDHRLMLANLLIHGAMIGFDQGRPGYLDTGMHISNIMFGHTASDPELRAYFVDGEAPVEIHGHTTIERAEQALNFEIPFFIKGRKVSENLFQIIDDGLAFQNAPWWEKLFLGVAAIFRDMEIR